VPVVSSEWGYYNTPGGYTAEQQAQFLPRQWLFNMAHDVELSIWYDWRNDGHDPHDTEQNFGTVTYDFEPKLSYYAAQTLIETLRDYRFMRRIPLENPDDYLLLFQKEASVALAGWTTDAAHPVVLPLPAEQIQTLGLSSESGVLQGEGGGVTVELGAAPRYLLLGSGPGGPVALLGGWRPLHTINVVDLSRNEGVPVIVHNPFPGPLEAELQLTAEGHMLGLTWISVPPGETALFRIPVQIDESLRGSVSAKIAFITPDGSPQLIQSALVWLLIVPEP